MFVIRRKDGEQGLAQSHTAADTQNTRNPCTKVDSTILVVKIFRRKLNLVHSFVCLLARVLTT